MSAVPFPSLADQLSTINSNINGTILNVLMLGLYTTVYIGTVYIYFSRKASQSTFVVLAITILFLANVAQSGLNWFFLRTLVDLAGQPEEQFFILSSLSPGWALLLTDILTTILSVVADALLIWRCYHAWDRSAKAIFVSFILLISEAALYMAFIITVAVNNLNPPVATGLILNKLLSAALFTSFGVTFLTTLLIIYRISSVYKHGQSRGPNQQRLRTILDLLVQSAALYGVALLAFAILGVVPQLNSFPTPKFEAAEDIITSLFPVISGFAPTIMVARVALASSSPTLRPHAVTITDLQFNGMGTTVLSREEQDAICE